MKRECILNCPVDLIEIDVALNDCIKAIENQKNFQIITLNPEMIINAQDNLPFLNIIKNAELIIPESVGVHIALKMKGIKELQRVRGVDFSRKLIELASKNSYKIAFLGAKEEVIQKAKENILSEFENLDICYLRNGYFSNDDEIINEIKNANPDILLVGLGSPRQEEFISKLKNVLSGCVMIGVGGSFDVFSGIIKEAPKIYQKLGLEWLYRTVLQPERFKRIFPLLPIFLIKCIISIINKKDC